MRQLTHSEKQQLATKVKDEQERQEAIREMYPNTPKDLKKASLVSRFTSSYL